MSRNQIPLSLTATMCLLISERLREYQSLNIYRCYWQLVLVSKNKLFEFCQVKSGQVKLRHVEGGQVQSGEGGVPLFIGY